MLAIGTVLSNNTYTVTALLGRGGFGAVYEAREGSPLNRTVAIKQALLSDKPGYLEIFQREAALLANVTHHGLPRVYTFFQQDDAYFFVMQYIAGTTLNEYVLRLPDFMLSVTAALTLLEPVIDALEHLHACNPPIIHRDVKPANIRVTPEGKAFLVDLGIAKTIEKNARTASAARAVTSGYSPFEQHSGEGTDARADIYALGATLYYALSGVTPDDAQLRVRTDPLRPLAELNPAVSSHVALVIAKMMSVWADDRYATIADVRKALGGTTIPELQSLSRRVHETAANNEYHVPPVSQADTSHVEQGQEPPVGDDELAEILARLEPDVIVSGTMFPERVQLTRIKQMGTMVQLFGEGLTSGGAHKPQLTRAQLRDLVIERSSSFDGDPQRFKLGIEARRLGLAYEYDPYFSLSIARVDPLPHQLEAVYDYFLKQPRIRFLLADDPGAGKTIMAGLLIKELKIRGLVKRVLIITPANLTFQWQRELKDKFRESFDVVRSDTLRNTYGVNPWQEKHQVISSISWVSRMDDARDSLLRSRWDLVIVDEAHKMSAYSEDKKTLAYQLGEELERMTDHYLLMTATPHKGDPENFALFLRLLDPDVYGDVSSLEAAMSHGVAPFYLRRVKEAMVTFPDPVTGEVKTLFTRRVVRTTEFELTIEEADFYDALTAYVEEQSVAAAADTSARGRAIGFTMAMLQRRFASSVYAVRRSLERMRDRRAKILADPAAHRQEQLQNRMPENFDELSDEDQQQIIDALEQIVATADPVTLRTEIMQLERLIVQAHELEASEAESKLAKLREVITEDRILNDPKLKLLIFTEHRDTLDFLVTRLRTWGLSVTQIAGGMPIGDRDIPGSRIYAEREFRETCQVLVATEAAGEGINLQFCWLMINYDIPWNPVRLEQRMGRIHRYGQEKDCLIYNFVSTRTREGRVLQKLFERIREIEGALDPNQTGKVFNVLGDIFPANQLERMLRDMYARNLTEAALKDRIVDQVDPERFRQIAASTLEGLAKRELNLAAIVGRSAEARERRLVPEVIRDFFLQAAQASGVTIRESRSQPVEKPDGEQNGALTTTRVFRIANRVPTPLIAIGERQEPRFGTLGREYNLVTFDQAALKADATLEWVTPGHPLFEAVREDTSSRAAAELQRGAVFYELQRRIPARLDVFEAAITDGLRHELNRRLYVVEVTLDGQMSFREPTLFLDLVPAQPSVAVPDATLPGVDETQVFLSEQMLTTERDTIGAEREREIDMVAQHIQISLDALINRQSLRFAELQALKDDGDETPLLAANLKTTEDRLDTLNNRLEQRMADIARERYCTIGVVRLLGQAWVLPHPERATELLAPMVDDPDIEKIAVQAVMTYERAAGRTVITSVERENRGFDLISRAPTSDVGTAGEVRFIEVKGRSAVGEIALTSNEYRTAERLKEDYWLYVVYNCATIPVVHMVQNPARLQWNEVVQVAHYRIGARQIMAG